MFFIYLIVFIFVMTIMTMKSFFDRTFSIDDQVLSRICENILPEIHDQVNKLTIEQNSIELILLNFTLYHLLILKKKYFFNI